MQHATVRWSVHVLLVCAFAGCGGGSTDADAGDASPADSSVAPDAGDASPADSSVDAAAADSAADAALDGSFDATLDAVVDATPDATADATPDATADATPDATVDASVDATPDATTGCAINCDCPQGRRCIGGSCRGGARAFYCCDTPGCPEGSMCTDRAGFTGTCPATLTECAVEGGVCIVQFTSCPATYELDTSMSCGTVRSLQCCAKL